MNDGIKFIPRRKDIALTNLADVSVVRVKHHLCPPEDVVQAVESQRHTDPFPEVGRVQDEQTHVQNEANYVGNVEQLERKRDDTMLMTKTKNKKALQRETLSVQ